ncbi:MAG: SBBP repeat-containing protein, partial [Bryobacteraceae bacterium]|nr:SBBP repeat-containing protein [Bryobacteraceae bacterium]
MRLSLSLLLLIPALFAQQPRLDYATYLGAAGSDAIIASTTDREGNIWVTGYTTSADFPAAGDAFRNAYTAGRDIFVTKIDPRRERDQQIVYSTFIGGSGNDEPTGIALDDAGFVYICGFTNSDNFPLAGNAFQGRPGGREDGFVLKLNPRIGGDPGLVYSTYLGGSSADRATALVVRGGRIHVVGYTNS